MKKVLLMILTVTGMIGCTKCSPIDFSKLPGNEVEQLGAPDASLEARLKADFYRDMNQIGATVNIEDIKFTFFPEQHKNGVCSSGPAGKYVSVSISKGRGYCEIYRSFVHEVAHCTVYGHGHDDSHPNLMQTVAGPEVISAFCSNNARKYDYLKEIFR